MTRALSVASVIDKNKVSSATAWIVLLDIEIVDPNTRVVAQVIRLAQNRDDIVFGLDAGGNPATYTAANFTLQVTQAKGSTPSVTIVAQDQQQILQSKMDAYAGGIFSTVVMSVVNSARLDQPPEIAETFQVINSNVANYAVTIELGAENPLGMSFPKSRQFKDRCVWRYKGYGCAYAGALATCDYTKDGPNGCIQHNNTINFRGLPGLVRMNL